MKRLKISKKDFVEALTSIKQGLNKREQFDEAIEKYTDTYFICNIGTEWLETAIKLLEKAVGDKPDKYIGTTIQWWLYENVDKRIKIDGEWMEVKTPEQLYDFFKLQAKLDAS